MIGDILEVFGAVALVAAGMLAFVWGMYLVGLARDWLNSRWYGS